MAAAIYPSLLITKTCEGPEERNDWRRKQNEEDELVRSQSVRQSVSRLGLLSVCLSVCLLSICPPSISGHLG